MKFDEILQHVGEYGWYQKKMLVTICLPVIGIAHLILLPVFIFAIPDHRCAIPTLENDTYSIQGEWHFDLINSTVPTSDDGWARCTVYHEENNTELECDEWVYDTSQYQNTFMTQNNFVCGKEIFRSHANMAVFAGKFMGALTLGMISDLFGRKVSFILGLYCQIAFGIGTAFTESYALLLVCRFCVGLSSIPVFITGYLICLEFVGPSKRNLVGNVVMITWAVAVLLLAMIAYFIRDWKTLTLVTSVPNIVFLTYWWVLPESPRWLISKGRYKEAEEIIRKVNADNGKNIPEGIIDQLSSMEDEKREAKIWELFTTPRLLLTTLIVYFNWLSISCAYYGLTLNVSNLSGNEYLNFTLGGLAELIAYSLCILLLDKVGRKLFHCVAMFVGGVACVGTIFPVLFGGDTYVWITTGLATIGRLCSSGAFAVIYIFTSEIFPTTFRNRAMGSSSTCSQIGGMLSPYVADLGILVGGDLLVALPLIVFGSASITAGLLALFLPETLNQKLPENMDDMKQRLRRKPRDGSPARITD